MDYNRPHRHVCHVKHIIIIIIMCIHNQEHINLQGGGAGGERERGYIIFNL